MRAHTSQPTIACHTAERLPLAGTRHGALDGLRGVAILAVLLNHFLPAMEQGWQRWVVAPFQSTWGTTLFFLLSGFFVVGRLLEAPPGRRTLAVYCARRMLRVGPLYFLILSTVFLVCPRFWHMPYVAELSKVQGPLWYLNANHALAEAGVWIYRQGPVNLTPLWSVSLQEQLALGGAVLVLFLPRRCLGWVLGACIPAALLARGWLWHAGASPIALLVSLPARVDVFALGALLAMAARQPEVLRRLVPYAGITMAAGALWWTSLAAGGWHAWSHPLTGTVGYSIQMAAAGALVVWLLMPAAEGPRGRLAGLLENRLLQVLGRYSFGLFCLHQLIWTPVRWAWPEVWGDTTGWGFWRHCGLAALGIAASLAVAWASYRGIERPLGRFKSFFPWQPVAPEGPAAARPWEERGSQPVGVPLA